MFVGVPPGRLMVGQGISPRYMLRDGAMLTTETRVKTALLTVAVYNVGYCFRFQWI